MAIEQNTLEEYRQKVFAALKAAGYPVDEWRRAHEIELAQNPTKGLRPFTKIKPPKYGKIKKLRCGFEEFISHPAHGKPVPRCQAAKKRTDGKVQCSKFAVKGKHVCRTHGGGKGSGVLSENGRERQRASATVSGLETMALRKKRSSSSKARRVLSLIEKRIR